MSCTSKTSINKLIKLVKKLEEIEEFYNKTLSDESQKVSTKSFLTQCTNISSNFSFSTTPFLVQEQIMCKIRKDRITPVVDQILMNKTTNIKQPSYSKRLINKLKKLLTLNSSSPKKHKVQKAKKKPRKNKKHQSFCLNNCQTKAKKKCRRCKDVFDFICKLKQRKKNKHKKDQAKILEKNDKTINNISFVNVFYGDRFPALEYPVSIADSLQDRQKDGSNIKNTTLNNDLISISSRTSIPGVQVVQADVHKTNEKIQNENQTVNNIKKIEQDNSSSSLKELNILCNKENLHQNNSPKDDHLFKKPFVPLKNYNSKISRAPSIRSQKSELIIDLIDIHTDPCKEIKDKHLIDSFKKIELWKTYGNPWINELAELYNPVSFPSQKVVINGSDCGSVWKSPDLSPIYYQ